MPTQVLIEPTVDASTLAVQEYGVLRAQSFQVIGKPAAGQTINFEILNANGAYRVATLNDSELSINATNDVITFYAPIYGRFNKSASAGNELGLRVIS